MAPKNRSILKNGKRAGPLLLGGDGVVVVRLTNGRTTGFNSGANYSSKAGQKMTKRGSEDEQTPAFNYERKIIKNIANLKNLVRGYELIKSKPGNMTHATKVSLDGMSKEYLTKIQSKIRAGRYEFAPAIQIPKKGGKNESRALSMARDKVVQKALQLVMEPIYEKQFLDTSHGFRPRRGTRTAIQYLDANFQSVHYVIEADLSKALDTIPQKLMTIISREIECEKTLKLIKSSLKAGYIEFGNLHNNLETPQSMSPLLCNIYFHELDVYMESLKQEFNSGSGTNEYEKLKVSSRHMRRTGQDKSREEYLTDMRGMLNTSKKHDSNVRIHYVRYADDFVIGVEGSYQIAKTILAKVRTFISSSLSLKLNETKTGITKYSEKRVKFLGYNISGAQKGIKPESPKNSDKRRKKIRIEMDTEKVLKRLEMNRFIRKRTSPKDGKTLIYRGTFKGNLINLDHADIIQYYNSVIRGVYNYYSFTNNTQALAHII